MDITELILDDHHAFRQGFARLDDIDPNDTEGLTAAWEGLADFLDRHAAAEEAVFYPEMLRLADPDGDLTKDAIGDHNDIRDGIAEAGKHRVGSDAWWEGVNAARSSNTEHMGEEEDDDLSGFRKKASLELRDEIARKFIEAKSPSGAKKIDQEDKDPDEYVEANS